MKHPPLFDNADRIFIAGSFNSWNAGNKKFRIDTTKNKGTLQLAPGDYEYKFTKGDWQKVETGSDGKEIANRLIKVSGDTTIRVEIMGWNDDESKNDSGDKIHTASSNVKIMDTAFSIPQLNRKRRIWLYLPQDYDITKSNYPVLYMHDGQNLFDNATSYAGEWGIDEYLDSIFSSGKKQVIVVGIDNGLSKRMTEYNPYFSKRYGAGEGDKYVDFLVKTLKPFIDRHYRTLPGKKDTYIAGSSMGALISFYAVLKYPLVYGGAGIFSPSFWAAPRINRLIKKTKNTDTRLFFYAGGKEGDAMILNMRKIEKDLKVNSRSSIHEIIDPDAEHNEAAWSKYFPAFYKWTITGEGQ